MNKNSISSDNDTMILVNSLEEFVKMKVRELEKEFGACECDTCFFNACALALNALQPKYVTTEKGAKILEVTATKLENQTEILVAAMKAVQQVMDHPHH